MKIILLLVCAAMSMNASEMTIVRDGRPEAVIVLRKKPTASAQMAAFELNHHIEMVTGTRLPVRTEEGIPGKIRIELGGDAEPSAHEYSSVQFRKDRIQIRGSDTADFHKVDYGNSATFPKGSYGTLFAVYDFLERFCGVRWYGLTDDATAFVPRRTLTLECRDFLHIPKTDAFRSIYNSGGRAQTLRVLSYTPRDEALMKYRWRCAAFFGQTNHNLYRIYFTYWDRAKKPAYAALFRGRKPEYFAQGYAGKMMPLDGFLRREYPDDPDCPPGICFSSPGPVEFFAEQAVDQWNGKPMPGLPSGGAYLKRLPGRPFFSSVQHLDTQGPCYCAACAKRAAENGQNHLMWQWIADIANAAGAKQPGLGISTLAYQRTLAYPEHVKLPENLCVQLCLGIHAWWNPEFYRIQHDEIYRKWMENKGGRVMTCWLYLFGPGWDSKTRYRHKFFPGVYPRHAGRIVREMVRDGIRGAFLECEWSRNMLEVYLAARLFYDSEQDVDALLDEHFRLFYGRSGDDMKAFFTELENIYWNWRNCPASMFGNNGVASRLRAHSLGTGMLSAANNWSVGTAGRMKRLSSLIDAAEAKADTPLIRKRISWIRKGFWDQALEGYRDHQKRMKLERMPEKSIVIARCPDADGNPDAVDWTLGTSAGDAHTLEDGTVLPNTFRLKLAADSRYLYFDFLEERNQTQPRLWKNFFEIFLSADGAMPVTQIAFAPSTKTPLCYRTEMVNDVTHTGTFSPPLKFLSTAEEGKWRWRMALPLSVIGPESHRRFRMNFRRFREDCKLVWNKFFASAPDCVGNMGYVSIRGGSPTAVKLGFHEGRIRGEIASWHLSRGTIRFSSVPDAADVVMKAKDALISAEKIPVVQGETVRIRWRAEGDRLPRCGLQFFKGSGPGSGVLRGKTGRKKGDLRESLFSVPEGATACRCVFSADGPLAFRLSDVTVSTGENMQ